MFTNGMTSQEFSIYTRLNDPNTSDAAIKEWINIGQGPTLYEVMTVLSAEIPAHRDTKLSQK